MSLPLKLNAAAAAGVYDSTRHDEKVYDKRPVSNSWTPHPYTADQRPLCIRSNGHGVQVGKTWNRKVRGKPTVD